MGVGPVDWASPVTRTNLCIALGSSHWEFSARFLKEILRTSSSAKFEKKRQVLIMALVTLFAVSLQLIGMLMMWELHQPKQDYANWRALWWRIHYAFILVTGLNCSSTSFPGSLIFPPKRERRSLGRKMRDPGNEVELFIWQNFPAHLPRSWLAKPRS